SDLKEAARPVLACLKDYQDFLEKDLLPRSQGDWRIGKDKFTRKLELELNAGMSAEQVLKDAETEAERAHRDMYIVARQRWAQTFHKKPVPPDDADGRRSTILQVLGKVNLDHGRAEDLVRDIGNVVADIKAFIKDNDILRLPDPDQCRIVEMPEFQ